MKVFETEHYRFYYGAGTKAEADILSIAAGQEACYRYICQVLKTEPSFRINYFLCNSPEEVGRIYGDDDPCNGFAAMPDTVYAVYNEQIQCVGFHEDAHIISYTINRPDCPAIREGLAMYFDRKWWGISNLEWAGFYLKQNGALPVSAWLEKEIFIAEDCWVTYPVMGAFTDYLIATYGIGTYIDFYSRRNLALVLEEAYGKAPAELEREFAEYVGLFRMDAGMEERMRTLLNA